MAHNFLLKRATAKRIAEAGTLREALSIAYLIFPVGPFLEFWRGFENFV